MSEVRLQKAYPSIVLLKNNGFEKCPLGEHITSLQKGEVVHITSASHRSHWGLFHSDHWYLVGSAILNGKKHNFYNYLGFNNQWFTTRPSRNSSVVVNTHNSWLGSASLHILANLLISPLCGRYVFQRLF